MFISKAAIILKFLLVVKRTQGDFYDEEAKTIQIAESSNSFPLRISEIFFDKERTIDTELDFFSFINTTLRCCNFKDNDIPSWIYSGKSYSGIFKHISNGQCTDLVLTMFKRRDGAQFSLKCCLKKSICKNIILRKVGSQKWILDIFKEVAVLNNNKGDCAKWYLGFLAETSELDFTLEVETSGNNLLEDKRVSVKKTFQKMEIQFCNVSYNDKGSFILKDITNNGSTLKPLKMTLMVNTESPNITCQNWSRDDKYYVNGERPLQLLSCEIKCYPLETLNLTIEYQTEKQSFGTNFFNLTATSNHNENFIKFDAPLNNSDKVKFSIEMMNPLQSGSINVKACQSNHCDKFGPRKVLMFEHPFESKCFIENNTKTFLVEEDELFSLKCGVIHEPLENHPLDWYRSGHKFEGYEELITPYDEDYTTYTKWKIINLKLSGSKIGTFHCRYGLSICGNVTVKIQPKSSPHIDQSKAENMRNGTTVLAPGSDISFSCPAIGTPNPKVKFSLNDKPINCSANYVVAYTKSHTFLYHANLNGKFLNFSKWRETNEPPTESCIPLTGIYKCTAKNIEGQDLVYQELVSEKAPDSLIFIASSTIITILSLSVTIAIFYCYKLKLKRIKKEYEDATKEWTTAGPEKAKMLRENFKGPNQTIYKSVDEVQNLSIDPKWRVDENDVFSVSRIGEGQFGVVFVGTLMRNKFDPDSRKIKKTFERVALKKVKSTSDLNDGSLLTEEAKILSLMEKHKNLVNLVGVCVGAAEKSSFKIIVEFCSHGNLRNVLKQHKKSFVEIQFESIKLNQSNEAKFKELIDQCIEKKIATIPLSSETSQQKILWLTSAHLLSWAYQVCLGMEHIASKSVIHCDLACRNVLLADNNVVKICDFGLSKHAKKNGRAYVTCHERVPLRCAPEIEDGRITIKNDVWMYGTLLGELFTFGDQEYYARNKSIKRFSITKREEPPSYAPFFIYNDVMLKCWNKEPKARPDFSDISVYLSQMFSIEKSWLPTKESKQNDNDLVLRSANVIELSNPIYQSPDGESSSIETDSQGYLSATQLNGDNSSSQSDSKIN